MNNYEQSFYLLLLTISFLVSFAMSAAAQTPKLQAINNKQEIQKARNFITEAHNFQSVKDYIPKP